MSVDASSEATFGETMDYFFGVPFPSKRKAAAVQERELKVGDRVSASGGYTFDPIVGVIVGEDGHGAYTVRSNVHLCNQFKDEWFYYKDELTLLPPSFPPGTRVRVVRNTNHYAVGDTGTVTLSSDESVGVRMDNGRYWSFKPEDLAVVPASAEGKPKFKAGDRVTTCGVNDAGEGVVIGTADFDDNFYKVKFDTWYGTCSESERNLTLVEPRVSVQQDNTIHIGEFKANLGDVLATACGRSPEPCIVMRLENGQPRPSSWPHVHQSAADATKEAERLASVNPGKQFDVYQRVTGRVGDVQVREVA